MNFEKQPPNPIDLMSQQILSQNPLHFACYAGDGELLDVLLSKTRTYNNNDDSAGTCATTMLSEEDALNSWTPAHWAAFYGQLNCLMKLHVRPSVGFDTPSQRSHTSPLHLAAQSGAILCLKWLLQCGATINRQDFMGETPLHKAAKAGNTDSAAMLVSHGASLDLKNQRGCTPADLAEQADHPTLPQYLRRSKDPQIDSKRGSGNISLPISDLGLSVPFPSSLPPPHLPHPDHLKYSKFPYVNHHCVDRSVLRSAYRQESGIVMNGLPIGNMHSRLVSSEADSSESFSSHSLQSCEMDVMVTSCRTKRPLDSMEEDSLEMDESGVSDNISPKRQCFGSKHVVEDCYPDYRDACNNNVFSYDDAFTKGVGSNSFVSTHSNNSSPILAHSSETEHHETMSAEQGYDSSMMCAMHDMMS